MRGAVALLAALALPACRFNDDHELYVANQGLVPIVVDVHADGYYGHDDDVFVVPPGGAIKEDYGVVDEMDVLIFRQSDYLLLFAANFDYDDFEDDHDTIEIYVTP